MASQCWQKWEKYLKQKSYTLSAVSTTTQIAGHAFDCYVELLHNGNCVARCFGEAKNYDLLGIHLNFFNEWLKDVDFKPEAQPPELAFMIAPACSPLLQRKLEVKNITLILSDKKIDLPPENEKSKVSKPNKVAPINPPLDINNSAIDINTAEEAMIIKAFKKTRIKKTTIERLINYRENNSYKNIEGLASVLKLTANVQKKLQKKFDDGEIYFS